MANANNSIVTGKFRGLLGKELVFREWEGMTVVAKAPRARSGETTPAQADLQEKFLLASRYAKAVLANPDQGLAEAYANVVRVRQNLYSRALEDFMTSPVVKSIDSQHYFGAVGDLIVTRAVDDFRVTKLRVEIYTADGTVLETGHAVPDTNGIDWNYTARQDNLAPAGIVGMKIKAIASDVPGNTGTLEVIL